MEIEGVEKRGELAGLPENILPNAMMNSLPQNNQQLIQNVHYPIQPHQMVAQNPTVSNPGRNAWDSKQEENRHRTAALDFGLNSVELESGQNFEVADFLMTSVKKKVNTHEKMETSCNLIRNFCHTYNFGFPEVYNELIKVKESAKLQDKRIGLVDVLLKVMKTMPPMMKEEITIPQLLLIFNLHSVLTNSKKRSLLSETDATCNKYLRLLHPQPFEEDIVEILDEEAPANKMDMVLLPDQENVPPTQVPVEAPIQYLVKYPAGKELSEEIIFYHPADASIRLNRVAINQKNIHQLNHSMFLDSMLVDFMVNYTLLRGECTQELTNVAYCIQFTTFVGGLKEPLKTSPFNHDELEQLRQNCATFHSRNRKTNFFMKKLVLFQVNVDSHWMLGLVVNPSGARTNEEPCCSVFFLDPMGDLVQHRAESFRRIVLTILETKAEHLGGAEPVDPRRVVLRRIKNLPVQNNLYDCGLYFVHYVEGILKWIGGFENTELSSVDWSNWHLKPDLSISLIRERMYRECVRLAPPEKQHLVDELEMETEEFPVRRRVGRQRIAARSRSADVPLKPRHERFHPPFYSAETVTCIQEKDNGKRWLFPRFSPRSLNEMPVTRAVRKITVPYNSAALYYH